MRRLATTAVLAAVLLSATACSGVNTAPDQIALHYAAGGFTSQKFEECVNPGTRKNNEGVDEQFFYYPVGQRTFKFSSDAGSDAAALTASTRDQQEITVRGTITFTLNTSCTKYVDDDEREWPGGKLQKFHEEVGQRNGAAFTEDSSQRPAGWVPLLITFVGAPTERSLDQSGGAYTWQNIYGDTKTQADFAAEARRLLPEKMSAAAGGEQYFDVLGVELDKPGIPDSLKAQFQAAEQARIEQETAAQKRAFQEGWPGGIGGYQDFQRKEAETRCLNEGRCPVVVPGAFPVVR